MRAWPLVNGFTHDDERTVDATGTGLNGRARASWLTHSLTPRQSLSCIALLNFCIALLGTITAAYGCKETRAARDGKNQNRESAKARNFRNSAGFASNFRCPPRRLSDSKLGLRHNARALIGQRDKTDRVKRKRPDGLSTQAA